ncbi:MAG: sodium:calcium antiporter [Chitinophagales bacterium]|nr:sodium:calcium antiporter [Chitinophagales bacterium]
MIVHALIFLAGLAVLLFSARYFTKAAEKLGTHFGLPQFVVGVFIVGIGTSLPELVSAIVSVRNGVSEIVPGNVFGSNISNLLLLTGAVAVINRNDIHLGSKYIYIDLHFLLGGFFMLAIITMDGQVCWHEGLFGVAAFLIFSFYLLKHHDTEQEGELAQRTKLPWIQVGILILGGLGIYLGAEYAVNNLSLLAIDFQLPASVVALTVLSLGTTLPELAVNISAIREGKAEMAIGNVLGSCVFNSMAVPAIAAFFGDITVPQNLLDFSLPVMMGAGLFFYLLTHDKKISPWEGALFLVLYGLFIFKVAVA